MTTNKNEAEWCLLQNQYDSYEKHSLYIKLTAILVLVLAEIFNTITLILFFILLVLWLQDAIWKTFQSRFEPRLLQLEKNIREKTECSTCQFNSEYQKVETSGMTKIFEYIRQAVRPTIAFPHAVLIVIFVARYITGQS